MHDSALGSWLEIPHCKHKYSNFIASLNVELKWWSEKNIHTTHKSTTETVHKKLQEVFFSNLTYCMPSEYRQPHWDTCSEAHVNINYTTSHERPKRKTCRRLTKKSRANFFPASAQPPTSCSVGHITYYVGKMTVFCSFAPAYGASIYLVKTHYDESDCGKKIPFQRFNPLSTVELAGALYTLNN